jgi:hypothetical protein
MDCSSAWYCSEALAKALAEGGVEVRVVIAVEAVERRVEMSYHYGDWLVGTREGRE